MMKHAGEPLSLMATARAVYEESGGSFAGLYRGLNANMIRAAVLGATKMATYDNVKRALRRRGWQEGGWLTLASSTAVGFALTCTTSPATNARTLMMSATPGKYGGVLDCMIDIVKQQGPFGLYGGFAAQWIRFAPYNVVQFILWEKLRKMCGLKPL